MFKPPGECPVCGTDVPRAARACPDCGADERSGWREETDDGGDGDEHGFDYEEFVEQEFGPRRRGVGGRWRVHPLWWVTALALLALFAWLLLRSGRMFL